MTYKFYFEKSFLTFYNSYAYRLCVFTEEISVKKNLLKLVTAVAVLSPVAFNLASCNRGDSSQSASDSSSSSYSVAEAKYNCAEEAAKNPNMTVLNFWHAFNNVNETAAVNVTNAFNEQHVHDESFPICVTLTGQKDYDTLFTQINASIQSGSIPDLVSSYPDHVANYREQNVVVDMSKFQDDAEYSIKDFDDILESYQKESYNYVFDKDTLDQYNQSLEAGAKYGKGSLMSLPINKSTEVMYYNKTFFDIFTTGDLTKATLSDGQTADKAPFANRFLKKEIRVTVDGKTYEGLPWDLKAADGTKLTLKHPGDIDVSDVSTWFTWDDVRVNGLIIQQITLNYYDVISGKKYNTLYTPGDKYASQIEQRGNFSISWDSVSNLFISLANSYNKYSTIEYNDASGKMNAKLLFNDQEVINQYQKMKNMFSEGVFTIPTLMGSQTDKYGTTQFINQNIFMSVGSTAGAALNGKGSFVTGVTAAPVVFNKTEGNHSPKIIQQGTNISMLAQADYVNLTKDALTSGTAVQQKAFKKQLAAWEYVKYATSYEGNMEFATGTNYLPTRTTVVNSEEYKQHIANKLANPATKAEAQAMQIALEIANTGVLFTDRPFPGSATLRTNSESIVKDFLSSTQSVAATINKFYSDESAKLKEF